MTVTTTTTASATDLASLRVPKALRDDVAAIAAVTNEVCREHLDEQYAELCRRLLGKLARKRPSPLARGDLNIWAAAVLYALGSINFLFDPTQRPHLRADDLARLTGVAKSTMVSLAGLIRRTLRLDPHEPELCRRELLEHHPYAWFVELDELIVDVRTLPLPLQEEARRRGLVPSLPASPSPPPG
ncbi:MAG: DUF6398 domain-containing protein [Dermatophilaceae bacterium]